MSCSPSLLPSLSSAQMDIQRSLLVESHSSCINFTVLFIADQYCWRKREASNTCERLGNFITDIGLIPTSIIKIQDPHFRPVSALC